jgi:hypothetical protein
MSLDVCTRDVELWQIALRMIDAHGDDALIEAAHQGDRTSRAEDWPATAMWLAVADCIRQLQTRSGLSN